MDSAFDIVKAIIDGKRRGMIRPLQALEQDIAKEYTGDDLQADLDGLVATGILHRGPTINNTYYTIKKRKK